MNEPGCQRIRLGTGQLIDEALPGATCLDQRTDQQPAKRIIVADLLEAPAENLGHKPGGPPIA